MNTQIKVSALDVDKAIRQTLPSYMKVEGNEVIIDSDVVYTIEESGITKIVADAGMLYPLYLAELDMQADRYSAEVARRCMTEDILRVVGTPISLKIVNASNFKLADLPEREGITDGKSAERGVLGFREHFNSLLRKRPVATA